MVRILQDIKLPVRLRDGKEKGAVVLEQFGIEDGETLENVVHERMRDHFETKNGVEAVQVIDDMTGDVLYRWTFTDEAGERIESARRKLAATAFADLQRRKEKSTDA